MSPDSAARSDWTTCLIAPEASINEALAAIETSDSKIALVVDAERHLLGTVTDGDIRRGILRGVALLGIDSVMAPKPKRIEAWRRIVRDLETEKLDSITSTIGFSDIIDTARAIVEGKVRGRVIVDMRARP